MPRIRQARAAPRAASFFDNIAAMAAALDPKPKATTLDLEPIAGVPSWDELYAAASGTATGQRILREVRMDFTTMVNA